MSDYIVNKLLPSLTLLKTLHPAPPAFFIFIVFCHMATAIDFEIFRPLLNDIFGREVDKSKGGRIPWDIPLIFKILILQEMYGIADEHTEFLINDRLSFQRFLGLTLSS